MSDVPDTFKERILSKLESMGGSKNPFRPTGMFGRNTKRLKEINKLRESKGLSKPTDLSEADEFMQGYNRVAKISDFLQVPEIRAMFTNPSTGKIDLLQGASALGTYSTWSSRCRQERREQNLSWKKSRYTRSSDSASYGSVWKVRSSSSRGRFSRRFGVLGIQELQEKAKRATQWQG